MTEVKIVIGERSFNVACNPGEQSDVMESAKLLNNEADIIQEQLGRLPEDKLLLLSGLMVGDKLRTLKLELATLQKKINEYEEASDGTVDEKEDPIDITLGKDGGAQKLQKISESLDKILRTVSEHEELRFKNTNESKDKKVQNSFL